jgi:hypothetical protein
MPNRWARGNVPLRPSEKSGEAGGGPWVERVHTEGAEKGAEGREKSTASGKIPRLKAEAWGTRALLPHGKGSQRGRGGRRGGQGDVDGIRKNPQA